MTQTCALCGSSKLWRHGRHGRSGDGMWLTWFEEFGRVEYRNLVGLHSDFIGFYSELMGFHNGLIGFHHDLMGFDSDLMGFNSDLMGYEWDSPNSIQKNLWIPFGKLT